MLSIPKIISVISTGFMRATGKTQPPIFSPEHVRNSKAAPFAAR